MNMAEYGSQQSQQTASVNFEPIIFMRNANFARTHLQTC